MKFTKKDKAIMIGLMIGDGYMNENGRLCIEHCEKQEEYCRYKAALLHSVTGGKEIKVHKMERVRSKRKDGKEGKTNNFITFSFRKQSKSFIEFRNILYKNGKKAITKEVLDLMDETSLMLGGLDDGNLNRKQTIDKKPGSYCLRLYVYKSIEECELLQKGFLEKYNIQGNVIKSENPDLFNLYCGVREGVKFINLIQKTVLDKIPSMSYKVLDIGQERRASKDDDIV